MSASPSSLVDFLIGIDPSIRGAGETAFFCAEMLSRVDMGSAEATVCMNRLVEARLDYQHNGNRRYGDHVNCAMGLAIRALHAGGKVVGRFQNYVPKWQRLEITDGSSICPQDCDWGFNPRMCAATQEAWGPMHGEGALYEEEA